MPKSAQKIEIPDYFGKINEKFQAEASPNEAVLVVVKSYRENNCSIYRARLLPKLVPEVRLYFGVLRDHGPFSAIDRENFFGGITIFFVEHVDWRGYDFSLKKGLISLNLLNLNGSDPNEPIYSPDISWRWQQIAEEKSGAKKPDFPLEIVVGYDKIQAYCAEAKTFNIMDFYLNALRLLRIVHIKLLPEIGEYAQKEKERILAELLKLVDEEEKLIKKIKSIYDSKESGLYYGDGDKAVVENNDDAFVYSLGHRIDLGEIRDRMKHLLKKALEFKMNELPWVKSFDGKPGFLINVPDFIKGLCSRLKKIQEK